MHAVFVQVRIKPGQYDQAITELHQNIVPNVKGAPGFTKGIWFGDGESGRGVVVFETEEQAKQVAEMAQAGPDDAVETQSVHVFEVHGEA